MRLIILALVSMMMSAAAAHAQDDEGPRPDPTGTDPPMTEGQLAQWRSRIAAARQQAEQDKAGVKKAHADLVAQDRADALARAAKSAADEAAGKAAIEQQRAKIRATEP